MNGSEIELYLLHFKGSEKSFPFDKTTAVYKVGGKMFALMGEHQGHMQMNLKCDPVYALELRHIYNSVTAGYHMNKKHWNTIILNGDVPKEELFSMIEDSYNLVFYSLTKKLQASILNA
ncbi:MAG TPA: MmcQ/YjbR family DNA-binding protein [Helicobacteraceae bacterium]|nr:MmcQ/YjbR family DNA-binding protein [Helicobacteraceae bacterium]